jgi:triacylglycerol lipase
MPGPRVITWWIGCIVALLLAGSVAVVLTVRDHTGSSAFTGPVPDQSRPGPVLLVPGYGGKKAALDTLAKTIESATGRTAVVINLLGDGTGDLVAEARLLDGDIMTQIHGGAPSVDLIGYSAGGIVVRLLYSGFAAAARHVRRVITLGSPFHGTAIATLAAIFVAPDCPTACKQLAPVNSMIKNLSTTPLPRGLPWLSIWSTGDTTIRPTDSSRLRGAVNVPAQSICPHESISHSSLPTDPLVDGLVLGALGTGPIRTPAASECDLLRERGHAAL